MAKSNEIKETTFTKEQIVNSKRYAKNKDLLNANLQENKKYTTQEVDGIIKDFLKGKVI